MILFDKMHGWDDMAKYMFGYTLDILVSAMPR